MKIFLLIEYRYVRKFIILFLQHSCGIFANILKAWCVHNNMTHGCTYQYVIIITNKSVKIKRINIIT